MSTEKGMHHTDTQDIPALRDSDSDLHLNPYKADFPLLAANPHLSYLDNAATSQRPQCVLDTQRRFYETMNANPLRGLYDLSVKATQAVEKTRTHIAQFVGGHDTHEVVFTKNASEALNLSARCLENRLTSDDEVVISIMEHHSNLIPWQQICARTGARLVYLRPESDGIIRKEEIDKKITAKTAIVSCTHLSNVLGTAQPIKTLSAAAHAVGAIMVVDAAQSAPHIPLDVSELGCDMLALSAHKLMGPLGIGTLWGTRELLEELPPFLVGGEMIKNVTETEATWASLPEKYEAGTQDAAGICAFDAALDLFESIGHEKIMAREQALITYLFERLSKNKHVSILGPYDPKLHIGVVAFNINGIHPHDVASLLDTKGVCIRAGHHCAQPLLSWMGIQSCCRASIAYYNDATDIDRLLDGLDFVWRTFNGA